MTLYDGGLSTYASGFLSVHSFSWSQLPWRWRRISARAASGGSDGEGLAGEDDEALGGMKKWH